MAMQDLERQVERIHQRIENYLSEGKKLFVTSSFQTHSLPMLHILSRAKGSIPVCFLNTGYHFPETIRFRDEIAQRFGLCLIDLHPVTPKNLQKDARGNLYFASDPDYCCYMNKVQPLEPLLAEYDVWINGIRAEQNDNRKKMKQEEQAPKGTLRYHPMLHWTERMIVEYVEKYNIPRHPLEEKGYLSIGCEPCTTKFFQERDGRWFGLKKAECGLHTDLVEK